MRFIRIAVLFGLFFFLCSTPALDAVASQRLLEEKYSTVVDVEIRAVGKAKARAENAVLAELSKIKDVRVRSKDRVFNLKILITPISPPNKKQIWGYAASLVVERFAGQAFVEKVILMMNKNKNDRPYKELARSVLDRGAFYYATQKVVAFNDLEAVCRELVAVFDAEVLAPDRKRFAELMELEKGLKIPDDKSHTSAHHSHGKHGGGSHH